MDRLGGEFGAFGAGRDFDDGEQDGYADDGAHSNPPPSPVGQDERRMQVRAYNHWSSLLGSENLPHIEDLEPEFLGDFGPYSVLFDFSTGSGTPTIQFIGKELSRECRLDGVAETLQDIPRDSLLAKIAENYLQVVSAQAPVSFEAESANAKGKTVAYRGILLPYSSDFDTIDFVYAVINWKEIADARTADALLEEIDRAMDYGAQPAFPHVEDELVSTADIVHFDTHNAAEEEQETVDATDGEDSVTNEDNILALHGAAQAEADAFDDLPAPSFGHEDEDWGEHAWNQPSSCEAGPADTEYCAAPASPRRNRGFDALGNPVGGAAADEDATEDTAPNGITTAADYGLPEWDDEEPEADDVDDLVNPLADIDLNSRLLALVNAGTRGKKTVDLATLSDPDSRDEGEPKEESELFRPKAPSVDTLLSPEPYEEDDEAEFEPGVMGEYAGSETADYEYAAVCEDVGAEEECEAVSDWQGAKEVVSVESQDAAGHDFSHDSAEAEPLLIDTPEPAHDGVLGEDLEGETAAEPLELAEEMILEDVVEVAVDETAQAESETAETLENDVTDEEHAPVALVQADTRETGEPNEVPQGQDPESLTGLLAAVRELTEAARNTEDLGRRALYEAVGRAFDVSIKAVIASERHAGSPRGVVEQFPLDAVSQAGPELALVMVRRNADGQTEVVGEVPHDSILMETATLKLASK